MGSVIWYILLVINIIDSIPEVPYKKQQLIGSGAGAGDGANDSDTDNLLTPVFSHIEHFFVVPDEQVGQFYAYRINSSAVVLGTRKAGTFGASVGIGSVAQGQYQCLAKNVNAKSNARITISVSSKLKTFCGTHSC